MPIAISLRQHFYRFCFFFVGPWYTYHIGKHKIGWIDETSTISVQKRYINVSLKVKMETI
jgi:hypothetical protein